MDHVSRDGVHKTTMVWMYDFREANGAKVCFGQVPIPHTMAEALIAYSRECLDALNIRNGATHSEIILTSDGPCLVEAAWQHAKMIKDVCSEPPALLVYTKTKNGLVQCVPGVSGNLYEKTRIYIECKTLARNSRCYS